MGGSGGREGGREERTSSGIVIKQAVQPHPFLNRSHNLFAHALVHITLMMYWSPKKQTAGNLPPRDSK